MRLKLNCECGHPYAVDVDQETAIFCPKCGLQANPKTVAALMTMLQLAEQQYLSDNLPDPDQQN